MKLLTSSEASMTEQRMREKYLKGLETLLKVASCFDDHLYVLHSLILVNSHNRLLNSPIELSTLSHSDPDFFLETWKEFLEKGDARVAAQQATDYFAECIQIYCKLPIDDIRDFTVSFTTSSMRVELKLPESWELTIEVNDLHRRLWYDLNLYYPSTKFKIIENLRGE